MRSCDEILELISAALDGELSADEQAALDEHIACCPACSALLDDLRALHTAAADWEEVSAPAGFAAGVMSAIAADPTQEKADNVIPFPTKKAKPAHWKKWGVTAAAVAVVVLGAVSAPSLTGNFARKSAESANMAPAAYDAVADLALMEAENFNTNVEDAIAPQEARDTDYDSSPAEPVPSEDGKLSSTTKPYDPSQNAGAPAPSTAPEEELWVGVLVLEGPLEALSGQEGAVSSDGTVTYFVPADRFAEILKELDAEKPVGYSYTAGTPDAPQGKIIVQSN